MREIRFRAWTGKDMVLVHTLELAPNSMSCRVNLEFEIGYDKLMQFTGLKDKLGVDIYEGDICYTYEIGIGTLNRTVEFNGGAFCFSHKHCLTVEIRGWKRDFIEVIGNIHQNPELIT